MSNAPQPVAFWLSQPTRFSSDPSLIRVDWTADGVTHSALGTVDDTRIVWDLGSEVPRSIASDAPEAAYSQADYGDAHVPPGWTFAGFESRSAMEHTVECRCQKCGTVCASLDDMSTDGECPKCWIARMGQVEPAPVAYGTPEWLHMLRASGHI